MNFWEFVSSLVWPLVVIYIFSYLQKPLIRYLPKLIGRLSKVTYKDGSLHFDKKLRDVEKDQKQRDKPMMGPSIESNKALLEESKDAENEKRKLEQHYSQTFQLLINSVGCSPVLAVISSWSIVERELITLMQKKNLSLLVFDPTEAVKSLSQSQTLHDWQVMEVNSLFSLRNNAVQITENGYRISPYDAHRYIEAAMRTVNMLISIKMVEDE